MRIYKGDSHAFWAMTKNVLIAIQGRLWLAPAVMVLPILAFWTPLYCTIAGLIEADARLTLVGAAGYFIPYASMWSSRRLFPFHPLKALLYPLVAIPVICCMGRALFLYLIRGEVACGPLDPGAREPRGEIRRFCGVSLRALGSCFHSRVSLRSPDGTHLQVCVRYRRPAAPEGRCPESAATFSSSGHSLP